jgi:predicted Zn finger-like uncharacterized protein
MIITCASCLTKFNLDDSRIPAKGAKVRCSRCRHTFYVAPPSGPKPETSQEPEPFAKGHEEVSAPAQKKPEPAPSPRPPDEEEKWTPSEEKEEDAETFFFSQRPASEEAEEKKKKEGTPRGRTSTARRIPQRRRGPSIVFAVIVALVIIILGASYLYSEFGSPGKLSQLLSPLKKISGLWNTILGKEKEGLIIGGLSGYEEKIGDATLFVIDGKVYNQSSVARKHIKVKVTIFDQNKSKIAEKEALCGNIMSPADLKKMPPAFFQGEMEIQPQTAGDREVVPGKGAAFIVIFKDPSGQAKEFKVDLVEAPRLQE